MFFSVKGQNFYSGLSGVGDMAGSEAVRDEFETGISTKNNKSGRIYIFFRLPTWRELVNRV